MKVSEYIVDELFKFGVRNVFGYQGSNITYIIDAVAARDGLRYIQTYHEQGAAFAANGYAQASESLGVAIASGGPGALNLVTGIANAFFDSVPVLFISGDLSRRFEKSVLPQRQNGFQSTDIISIVRPITKYAELISTPDDIRRCLERAIYEAMHGRKGPVYLSIPHSIQRAEIEPLSLKTFSPEKPKDTHIANSTLEKMFNVVKRCHRPLLLLGGGCNNLETKTILNEFLKHNQLPAVVSLCGLSVLSHDNPSYVGFIGKYGHRHANLALATSDCLIVLGSRMDEIQIGIQKEFYANKTILHVDIDPSELFPYSEDYIPLNKSITCFLNRLRSVSFNAFFLVEWKKRLLELQHKYPILPATKTFTMSGFLREFSESLLPDAQIYVDVGLHQMSTAQAVTLVNGKKLFVSGGLGSMGYALPASIGGYFAKPERQTVCICGDGGFMMNLQELQTIAREKINIKIVVINNHCLGMIRNYQQRMLDGRMFGSVDGYQSCDLEKIATAFGLCFLRINGYKNMGLLENILDRIGPSLIEVIFPGDALPFPAEIDYPLKDDII